MGISLNEMNFSIEEKDEDDASVEMNVASISCIDDVVLDYSNLSNLEEARLKEKEVVSGISCGFLFE